jgi:hypothetical protein
MFLTRGCGGLEEMEKKKVHLVSKLTYHLLLARHDKVK